MFVSMNPKSIAAGPCNEKVVDKRRDVGSCFICERDVLRNLLLNIGSIHQVEPCHVVVQPSHTSCEVLIKHHVVLIVLPVRKSPFLAKSHTLRTSFRVHIYLKVAALAPMSVRFSLACSEPKLFDEAGSPFERCAVQVVLCWQALVSDFLVSEKRVVCQLKG